MADISQDDMTGTISEKASCYTMMLFTGFKKRYNACNLQKRRV